MLLPQLALVPEPGREPREYFSAPVQDVWLEIGFGAGEHLAWQAENHPGIGIIGVEPYVAGMAKLLARIAPLAPLGGEGQGEGAPIKGARGGATSASTPRTRAM